MAKTTYSRKSLLGIMVPEGLESIVIQEVWLEVAGIVARPKGSQPEQKVQNSYAQPQNVWLSNVL